MSDFVRACRVADVAPESAIPVEIAGTELAIVHSDGQFYAIADECSHAAIPLSEGDVGDGEIECYLHGSRFDLRTGEPIGLPATEPVEVMEPPAFPEATAPVETAEPMTVEPPTGDAAA